MYAVYAVYAPDGWKMFASETSQSSPKEPRGMANGRVYYVMVPEAASERVSHVCCLDAHKPLFGTAESDVYDNLL